MQLIEKDRLFSFPILLVIFPLFAYSSFLPATPRSFDGTITSVTLNGPINRDSNWLLMEQNLTRDDSQAGMRLNETQLTGQFTQQITSYFSVGLGYLHDWNTPLNKKPFDENRPYQDFIFLTSLYGFNLNFRTRIDERIRYDNTSTGIRLRESIQISRSLDFFDPKLSALIGNEVYRYLNNSTYGTQGISEYRLQAGFVYQINQHLMTDFSYLADYLYPSSNNELLINNLFINLRYQF